MENIKEFVNTVDPDEFAAAERDAEADGDTSAYTHKFRKPLIYNGNTYEELTFDWDTLTGKDSLSIEREMRDSGIPLVAAAFSGEYLIRMAARACTAKIGADAFRNMSMPDFTKIQGRARSFLLKSE
jgi:hypothetical protein